MDKSFHCGRDQGDYHTNPDQSQGGFVSKTATVESSVFIAPDAAVCERATVVGDAQLLDQAIVAGRAKVGGNTTITGEGKVTGSALINWETQGGEQRVFVEDEAHVYGYAQVLGAARVSEKGQVFGRAEVFEHAHIREESQVRGQAKVSGEAEIFGRIEILNGHFSGDAKACDETIFNSRDFVETGLDYCRHLRHPIAGFDLNQNSGVAPLHVEVSSLSEINPLDEESLSIWNFGEVGSLEVLNSNTASYTYENPGQYFLTYTVTNDVGNSDSVTVPITVLETPEEEQGPSAIISYQKQISPLLPFVVNLNSDDSYPLEGSPIVYHRWEFSDGAIYEGSKIEHVIEERGVYTVTLMVRDNQGREGRQTLTLLAGCFLKRGDTDCLYVGDHQLINDSEEMSIQASPPQNWDLDHPDFRIRLLADDFSQGVLDITSFFSAIGDKLQASVSDIEEALENLNIKGKAFQIQVLGFNTEGKVISGTIRRVHFARGSIRLETNRPLQEIDVFSIDYKMNQTLMTDSEGVLLVEDLPPDVYIFKGVKGHEILSESFALESFEELEAEVLFVNPFLSTEAIEENFKDHGDKRSFPEAITAYSDLNEGIVTKKGVKTIQTEIERIELRFKTFFINELNSDSFELLVAYQNDMGGLEIIHEFGATSELSSQVFRETIPMRAEYQWFYRDVEYLQESQNFYVLLRAVNRGREDNLQSMSAVGVEFHADPTNKFRITSLERIDNNPHYEFIPMSIDDETSATQNPFEKRPEDWVISWRIDYKNPDVIEDGGDLFLGFNIRQKDNRKTWTPDFELKNFFNDDGDGGHIIVNFPISELENAPFFENWTENSPEALFFNFALGIGEGDVDEDRFLQLSDDYHFPMRVLYNAKEELDCPLIGGKRTSFYLTHRGMKRLEKMLDATEDIPFFSCGNGAAPFGGSFDDFFEEEFQRGDGLEVSYFGFLGIHDLNWRPSHRLYHIDRFWNLFDYDFEVEALESREEVMGTLSFWASEQRKGLTNIFSNFGVREVQGLTLSRGFELENSPLNEKIWNYELIFKGLIPSLEVGEGPYPLTSGELNGTDIGSCQHFPSPLNGVDENCQVSPKNLRFSPGHLDVMTLYFD